jgi:hypothetical protein
MKKPNLLALLVAIIFPLATQAQETLTVCDGTATNSYVPMHGYYNDSRFKNEMIYPANMLGEMEGGTITTITFYAQDTNSWNSPLELTIDEVADTSYSGYGAAWKATANAQMSWTGTCTVVNGQWVIQLSAPYVYGGGNLLLSVRNTAAGTGCPYSHFYGVSTGYNSCGYCTGATPSSVSTVQQFLPKVTFGFTSNGNICRRVSNLTASYLTADSAVIGWNRRGSETSWLVYLNGEYVATATDSTYTFTDLTANTVYTAGVRAFCAEGDTSLFVNTPFRTGCALVTVGETPWTDNFESYAVSTKASDIPCWHGLNYGATTALD